MNIIAGSYSRFKFRRVTSKRRVDNFAKVWYNWSIKGREK